MLPQENSNPRLQALKEIVQNSTAADLAGWPPLVEKDYVIFGGLIILYNYIDLDLWRVAEKADVTGLLPAPLNRKKATIGQIEDAVLSLPCWTPENEYALKQIKEMRSVRNLIAHCAVRRFPNDDAYIFITKSFKDYRKQYGADPEPGAISTAISEGDHVKATLHHIQGLHNWLSHNTPRIEAMLTRLSGRP